MWEGSQERGIGPRQQTVERNLAGHIAQVLSLRIGYIPGERNQKTHLHAAASFLYRARITVENSAKPGTPPGLIEYFEAIRPRLPALDHDGRLRVSRLIKLAAKNAGWCVPRRVIV